MEKKNIIWLLVILVGLAVLLQIGGLDNRFSESQIKDVPYSEFLQLVDKNQIRSVLLKGPVIRAAGTDNRIYTSYNPNDFSLVQTLKTKGIEIKGVPMDDPNLSFMGILMSVLPILLFLGIGILFMRHISAGNNKAMSFGKSRAKLLSEGKDKVTFADVAGIDEAKQELQEVVDYLKEPAKFQRLGGRIPRGVLLVGSPGTGKTLLAKAIAGEAGVPFFSISGSDFVEMFVGVGASRVRDMFDQGKKNAPCILFVDEIDAVGRHRGAGMGGGNDEREQTLNQLLVEMDGFDTNSGVIMIAATNRPDVLDPALLRPGRFDRQVVVNNPDLIGREQILKVHMKKVPLAGDVDPKVIARGTPGFAGADLANIVNEAALIAARKNKLKVSMEDFEYAKDKVMMGTERRSMVIPDDEKKMTAYHEAGHAICGIHEPLTDPIHKATIIPRGRALGMVLQLPERDQISMSKAKLEARMVVLFGGRIAEDMIFGKDNISTGAQNDIKVATSIARRMVTEWGMSDLLGPVAYEEPQEEVFLGHSITKRKNMSDVTALKVDEEIRRILDEAYAKTTKILKENRHELEILAEGLLEYETLTGEEITDLLAGKEIKRGEDAVSTVVGGSVPVTVAAADKKDDAPAETSPFTEKTETDVEKNDETAKAEEKVAETETDKKGEDE